MCPLISVIASGVSLLDDLGGESKLRNIIDEFVDQIFDDIMIGFLFVSVDRARIKEMEYQFTAKFLGADIDYTGQPIQQAHAKHRIMGGHFDRRRQILKETIQRHSIDPQVLEAWLDHVDSLRPLITGQSPGECD